MTAKMLCLLSVALLVVGCKHEPGSRAVTSGQLKIGVDEAVYQAFLQEGAEFQSQYQGSNLSFVQYDAREAVILLAADSIRTIVIGRPLNAIESAALSQIKIPVDSHRVAMGGIAVVVHPSNPLTRLRLTQLDSIFSGLVTKWPGQKKTTKLSAPTLFKLMPACALIRQTRK